MQNKDFDRLFKERFEAFEAEPSGALWQKIATALDTPVQKKKKTFTPYWMAAASLVLLTSAVLWFNNPVEVIKLQGKSQGQVVVNQNKDSGKEAQAVEGQAPDRSAGKQPILLPTLKVKQLVAQDSRKGNIKQVTKMQESVSSQTPAVDEVLVATQNVSIDVKQLEKAPVNEEREVVMAKISENEVEDHGEAEVTTNPRIKSVGGLVNFVIAQVDKRDDKIIEFRDGEEGSAVSGINLGPLKFKSRNK